VISGPSGVGKSTLIARITKGERRRLAVSVTTRAPRPGEVEGVHYRFLRRDEFEAMRDGGLLLEWAEVHDHVYGTPASEVVPWLADGWTVVLDVDAQGFRAIRKKIAVVGVFVAPPSIEHLDARLRGRATECDERVAKRLEAAHRELEARGEYDHVVVNDDVDRAAREIEAILRA
jgi:guanylate kinase